MRLMVAGQRGGPGVYTIINRSTATLDGFNYTVDNMTYTISGECMITIEVENYISGEWSSTFVGFRVADRKVIGNVSSADHV